MKTPNLTTSGAQLSNIFNFGGTTQSDFWGSPSLIEIRDDGRSLEMIYKQTSTVTLTVNRTLPPQERVFKIIYSCMDGKWHKSQPIFGKIIPATDEWYDFDFDAEN